jgi:excisionase family DNA binding protein
MSPFKNQLLTSCALGGEQIDTDGSEVITTHCADASVSVDASASSSAPSVPNGRERPNSPRAPPWGTTPPAVAPLQPIGVPPLQAAALLGTSRSRIYRLLREEKLRAVKQGAATLVLTSSIREYAASLPAATFSQPREETVAA